MFVSKKKFDKVQRDLNGQIQKLRGVIIAIHGEGAYFKAVAGMKNTEVKTDTDAGDFIETSPADSTPLSPVEVVDKKEKRKMVSPKKENYDKRVDDAIKMFMDRKSRTFVQRKLGISQTTARRYLKMAISKRKVAKRDYADLNK